LVVILASAAGDGDYRRSRFTADMPGQLLQRRDGIRDHDERSPGQLGDADERGIARQCTDRSLAHRFDHVGVPVEAIAANRDEEVAGLDRPRIDREPADFAVAVAVAARKLGANGAGDECGRQRRRSSAARAISASSKGSTRPPTS
jgi:hypothetical protein